LIDWDEVAKELGRGKTAEVKIPPGHSPLTFCHLIDGCLKRRGLLRFSMIDAGGVVKLSIPEKLEKKKRKSSKKLL